MVTLVVRSGSLAGRSTHEIPYKQCIQRTGAILRSLAMQKVVGSSPIIRFESPC